MTASSQPRVISIPDVFRIWWPLAASWLLMGAELPVLSAIVARLPDPKIHLAAYGGVVLPLALIIESPVIMLLAASTALSKDWDSYTKLRRFMMVTGGALTGLHALVAFTPLYYFVVSRVIGVPPEIVAPARIGLALMLPWTWAIGFRRFNQGVLIRFGHSRAVSIGTLIRLGADVGVLLAGYSIGTIPGIAVAAGAVVAGVVAEAIYVGIVVQPVLRNQLRSAPPVAEPLTLHGFLSFYIPLAMTSLLTLLAQPIGSAAISRMPRALESLAVWPVVFGLIFMFRSLGVAYNEVVVALLDQTGSVGSLHRFARILVISTTLGLLAFAVTPLAELWFRQFSGLAPELVELARLGALLALPLPALSVLQSWYQGAILHGRHTRGISEAVGVFLACMFLIATAGVFWGEITGLYIGLLAWDFSMAVQTIWLWLRSRPALAKVTARDNDLDRLQQAHLAGK